MKFKKKAKEVWDGTHLGISFEINYWKSDPNIVEPIERENWTYYIYLWLDRIPEQYDPESFWLKPEKSGRHVYYKHDDHSIINSIDFHCGITWYSKESGHDDSPKIIKIGCDYQHYWDEGNYYNLESILLDVKNTIESFRALVPDYKYWCGGNGKLYNANEGVIKNEEFYSKEYYGETEWFKDIVNQEASIPTP